VIAGVKGIQRDLGPHQESTTRVSLNLSDVGHCSSASPESLLYTVGGLVSTSGSNPIVKGFRTSHLQ